MTLQLTSAGPSYNPALRGLGATDQQITSIAGQTAVTTGSLIALAVGGPALAAIVGGSIAAATAIATALESLFSGCGATCIQSTQFANQFGDLLSQNVHNYVSSPVRTQSMQAAALKVFDNAWAQLVAACSNPALGTAGQNCIGDRQQGACKWKSSPGGWVQSSAGGWTYTWAGPAGSGNACWNYFVGMRDPIANDPDVIPDSILTQQGIPTTGNATGPAASFGSSGIPVPLIFAAAALVLAFVMGGK